MMPATKKRVLAAEGACVAVLAVFAAATGWAALWPVIFGLAGALIVMAFKPVETPANGPAKAAGAVLCAFAGAGCVVWGVAHDWRVIVVGALLLALGLPAMWLVAHDRSPWWL